jgi:uncharacterized protein
MYNLFEPLTHKELDSLDDFLSSRVSDDEDTRGKDEGIYNISSLDGLLAAVVSAPVTTAPSLWLSVIWGDYEPEWKNENEFNEIFSLMMRHMNAIIDCLNDSSEHYEPIFLGRNVGDREIVLVDAWCTGYIKGVDLVYDDSHNNTELKVLLMPIIAFGTKSGWDSLENLNNQEQENISKAVAPNAKEIYTYWSKLRQQESIDQVPHKTFRHETPKISRNDPCPCGSGKKYKKCCLH